MIQKIVVKHIAIYSTNIAQGSELSVYVGEAPLVLYTIDKVSGRKSRIGNAYLSSTDALIKLSISNKYEVAIEILE